MGKLKRITKKAWKVICYGSVGFGVLGGFSVFVALLLNDVTVKELLVTEAIMATIGFIIGGGIALFRK